MSNEQESFNRRLFESLQLPNLLQTFTVQYLKRRFRYLLLNAPAVKRDGCISAKHAMEIPNTTSNEKIKTKTETLWSPQYPAQKFTFQQKEKEEDVIGRPSLQTSTGLKKVSWYFEPSQPQRTTSGLKTNYNLSPIFYPARKSSNTNYPKTTKSVLTQMCKKTHANIKQKHFEGLVPSA